MNDPTRVEKPNSPQDFDKSTGDRVEKKPQEEKSPQQKHDNEDHG